MELFALTFPCIALLCAPALFIVLGRPKSLTASSSATPEKSNTLSIIIPARNEEQNIGSLLASINSQELTPHEVIVVNDGSTDRTADIAREHGATVIDSQPLPENWKGKPWACQQGTEAAKGDWFLFLDADTHLEHNALQKLVPLTHASPQVYSLCPHHRIKRPYEELSAFFNTLMIAGSDAFGLTPSATPALFGQCMLISRDHYQSVGGHEAVKDKVLENYHLSTLLEAQGIARSCYLGKGTVSMRMHPGGFRELWASWQKGFSGGAANAAPRALLWSSIWISGLMCTIVSLILIATPHTTPTYLWLTLTAYLAGAIQCLYAFRLAGTFSPLNALLFPISLLFYQTLFFTSIVHQKRGKQTQWKGRQV